MSWRQIFRFRAVQVGASKRPGGDSLSLAARRAVEPLESRVLLCFDHQIGPLSGGDLQNALAEVSRQTAPVPNHDAAWYRPVISGGNTSPVTANDGREPVWVTNAAGLPLLNSRADGRGMKIFLDFDGYGNDLPFSTDRDYGRFNPSEQRNIYDTWREIISYFSFLDVDVTTIQPPTGGANPNFIWHRISNSTSGGAAYVASFNNSTSMGWSGPETATGRRSAIAHEIGHQLGLNHQGEFDRSGNLNAEYTDGYDNRNRPVMGLDFLQNVRGWYYGRESPTRRVVSEIQTMSLLVAANASGSDGFMPDDYGGSTGSAANLDEKGGMTRGIIEREDDVDVFQFTSVGGVYHVDVTPIYDSAVSPRIELLDSNGNIVAARDDADARNWNSNDQEFDIALAPGTYHVRVADGGDYSELGEYLMTASPLPGMTGWASKDVGETSIFRGGTSTFDASSGVLTHVAGGADIYNRDDQFRFTYTTLTGDGSITARVDTLVNTGFHAKSGVMIRQSLASNAAHAFIGVKPGGRLDLLLRATTGGTTSVGGPSDIPDPWVRLTRVGNSFTFASSADGVSWKVLGTTEIAMSGPVYIGLATCAWNGRAQTYSKFSNISLTGQIGGTAPNFNHLAPTSITSIAPASGASTGVNLAWSPVLGSVGYVLERSTDGVTYTTAATLSATVLSYSDDNLFGSMRYFYRVVAVGPGNTRSAPSAARSVVNKPSAPTLPPSWYAVPAFVSTNIGLNWIDTQGDRGYRVERSSDGGATFVPVGATLPDAMGYDDHAVVPGDIYTYRVTPITLVGDGIAPSLLIDTGLRPVTNLRLASRSASAITISWDRSQRATGYRVERSTDGSAWTFVGDAKQDAVAWTDANVQQGGKYYYRIFPFNGISSGGASNIVFTSAPAAEMPAGWLNTDIGTVAGGGSGVRTNPGAWSLVSGGSGIGGLADSFNFTYRAFASNDLTVVGQVRMIEGTDGTPIAGLMIRQDLNSGSSFAAITLGSSGVQVVSRLLSNIPSTSEQAVANVTAPYYLKLVRSGGNIMASYSADGSTFVNAGTVNLSLSGTFYVGMASTSGSTTQLRGSTFGRFGVGVTPPRVVQPASSDQETVAGKSATLTVLGADDSGEPYLTYTWELENGAPAPVAFSVNGTNAAKSTVVTFRKPGQYRFTAVIQSEEGLPATSTVTVRVVPTPSGLAVAAPRMAAGTAQRVGLFDQFSDAMAGIEGFTLSADAGQIDATGVFRAPERAPKEATITARSGSVEFTTIISVVATHAWYRADEAKGSTLVDSSGASRDGSLSGSYGYVAGKTGQAIDLSGGHASLPTGVVSTLTDFTIATWVRPDSKPTWSRIFDFGTGTGNYMFLSAAAGGANTLRFAIKTPSGGGEQVVNAPSFATGKWSHVAVTLVGKTATIYVDGVPVGSNNAISLNPSSLGVTTANYIGKAQFPDPTFDGRIDDFRIYGTGLSDAAVRGVYEAWALPMPPAAPTTLTAQSTSSSSATLAWTDNASDEKGYRLERSTDNGVSFAPVASLGANVTSYLDAGLAAGTTYVYRVVAFNDAGDSGFSNTVQAMTVPLAPSSLTATGGDAWVRLSWQASNGATGYEVRRATTSGGPYATFAGVNADQLNLTDNSVTNGTTYYYVVIATNAGGVSNPSSEAFATPQVPAPQAPSNLSITATTSNGVSLSWTDNATNEDGYQVERSSDGGATFTLLNASPLSANASSYLDSGLAAGTTHVYRVFAENAGGASAYSNGVSGTTKPDVRVGTLDSSSTQPGVGDTVVLSTSLSNLGNTTLQNVLVRFYDGNPSAGGAVIGSVTVPSLGENAVTSGSVNWSPMTSGSHNLYAVVDPDGTLGDTNLADNSVNRTQEVYTYFTYRSTARLVGTGVEGGREVHKWYAFDVNVPMDVIAQLRVVAEVGQYDVAGSTALNNRPPYLQSYVGDGVNDRQQIGEVQPNGVGNWAMASADPLVTAGIIPLTTNYVDLWIKDLDGDGTLKDRVKVDSVTVEIKYLRR